MQEWFLGPRRLSERRTDLAKHAVMLAVARFRLRRAPTIAEIPGLARLAFWAFIAR